MIKRVFGILFVSIALLPLLYSQGEISEEKPTLFTNERTFGVSLNSDGYGGDFTFGRYINARNRWLYGIHFDYVKHPKEYKSVVPYQYYTRRFVFGKVNHFWELKGTFGRQTELFTKSDKSSISVRLSYAGGVSLGFQKPIYYEILTFNSSGTQVIATDEELFDPAIHYYNYGGTAAFTKGLNEIKLIPGLTVRAGLTFEYSEREPLLHALETGIGLTAYPADIKIMETDERNFLFFQMFVGYRFGTILDISDAARAKPWKERRKERKEAIGDAQRIPNIIL